MISIGRTNGRTMKRLILLISLVFFTVNTLSVFAQNATAKSGQAAKTKSKKKAAPKKKTKKKSAKKSEIWSLGAGYISVNTTGKSIISYEANEIVENVYISKSESRYAENSFGGFLFADAKYAEFDLSFSGSTGIGNGWEAFEIGLSFYGKYPFKLGKSNLTLSPMLGVEYDIVIFAKDKDNNIFTRGEAEWKNNKWYYKGLIYNDLDTRKAESGHVMDLSNISVKFGADLRIPFKIKAKNLYFDAQYLIGYRFESVYERKQRELTLKFLPTENPIEKIDSYKINTTLKLAIGRKL
ncbi:MAG: hypothetical protein Ta2B_14150 [Termitinemataceae bacterium]|nr:MAG: hypothetical protein Ta2B_14150 [Termitinemataceae bacterium]